MDAWVRRGCAIGALIGAAWLMLMARGVRAEAHALLSPFYGEGIVGVAGLAGAVAIGLALVVVFSPLGRRR